MRCTSISNAMLLAASLTPIAASLHAQGSAGRVIRTPGAPALVLVEPKAVTRPVAAARPAVLGRFQPLSAAVKSALLTAAAAGAPSGPPFTMTVQAPASEGRGYLVLAYARSGGTFDLIPCDPRPTAPWSVIPDGPGVHVVAFMRTMPLPAQYLVHLQVKGAGQYYVYMGDGTFVPVQVQTGVQDIVVSVPTTRWDIGEEAELLILTGNASWQFLGVEVTPIGLR